MDLGWVKTLWLTPEIASLALQRGPFVLPIVAQ